ncbi:glycerol kinase 5, partial [Lasius niger]
MHIELIYPEPGFVEIDPDHLWRIIVKVIKDTLKGKHIMDVSCASATGIFDPFTMEWADWALHILKLPRNIFPEVVDTAGNFGIIPESVFGAEIPIYCSMADQAASLFGSGCFKPSDLKVTMGTGTFVNVNTGWEPHASIA